MRQPHTLKPGKKVRLKDYDANSAGGIGEELAAAQLSLYDQQIGELQDLLYAAKQNSVLIVLQGMDTSGKDGTIKRVMANVNPQGCRVHPFKVPNDVERAHDFLWRAHHNTPSMDTYPFLIVLITRMFWSCAFTIWCPRASGKNAIAT
ncbi:MAG TPA: hypothetical protein VFC63_22730 [Blastocatellia bacterium]|nr:hypothetical protein [Blastocatellia bacterium]